MGYYITCGTQMTLNCNSFIHLFWFAEGRSTAVSLDSKYTEVSILLNHKVDDLLVGIVRQIKFTPERHRKRSKVKHKSSGDTGNCFLRARHNVLEKLLGRKAKSCENLLVL